MGNAGRLFTNYKKSVTIYSVNKNVQEFRSYLEARYRPGTAKVYADAVARWLSSTNGVAPTQESAQAYINSLIKDGLSSSTVNLRAHSIKKWFKWQGSKIELDYPTSIRPRDPEYLSPAELKKVISVCRTPLEKALVVVLFDTALRISELLNIRVSDIDWENGLLSVTRKGGWVDKVNISGKGIEALKEWLSHRPVNDTKVFGSIEYYDAWRLLKKIGQRAKLSINLRPHIFRHSRAIQMLMKGATIQDVMLHLGHKNMNTTASIYGRFKAVDLKRRIPQW